AEEDPVPKGSESRCRSSSTPCTACPLCVLFHVGELLEPNLKDHSASSIQVHSTARILLNEVGPRVEVLPGALPFGPDPNLLLQDPVGQVRPVGAVPPEPLRVPGRIIGPTI